jgi:hypothetical protein
VRFAQPGCAQISPREVVAPKVGAVEARSRETRHFVRLPPAPRVPGCASLAQASEVVGVSSHSLDFSAPVQSWHLRAWRQGHRECKCAGRVVNVQSGSPGTDGSHIRATWALAWITPRQQRVRCVRRLLARRSDGPVLQPRQVPGNPNVRVAVDSGGGGYRVEGHSAGDRTSALLREPIVVACAPVALMYGSLRGQLLLGDYFIHAPGHTRNQVSADGRAKFRRWGSSDGLQRCPLAGCK